MFHSKVAWLLFYCSAKLQQQTEALRPNSLAELQDGRGRQSQNVNNFSRLISWNFWKIYQFIQFIPQMFRIRKNWIEGKTSRKFCLLDHSWNFYRSVHKCLFMGSCQKLDNFIDVKKVYFFPFEFLICFAKLSRIHSLYQVFLLD